MRFLIKPISVAPAETKCVNYHKLIFREKKII